MDKIKLENLLEYFKKNKEDFNDCLRALDDWNGYLGDDRWIEMEYFDEYLYNKSHLWVAQVVYNSDRDFNPFDNYWRFCSWDVLESGDEENYDDYLTLDVVEDIIHHKDDLELYDERLIKLLNDSIDNKED